MLELPHTLISFALVIGVLVFFHEMGHYLAARLVGIKVEAFSIGFGPKLFGWTDGTGTEWRVCLLLLGGYVKMHGMEQPSDVPDEVREVWIPGRTFQGKGLRARAFVVAAGPVANFVLAIVLLFGLYVVRGRAYILPQVQSVVVGGAAAAAGVHGDDLITAIDGAKIKNFDDLQRIVSASPNKPLVFTIERRKQQLSLTITPRLTDGVGRIGVTAGSLAYKHVSPVSAFTGAVDATYDVAASELQVVGQIISGKASTQDLSGVIGIAQASGEAAHDGWSDFIQLIAIVSVNLGLVNLFPIPVLDGGHLLFFAIEAVRRKPLSPRFHNFALYVGLSFILLLLLIGARNDLMRLGLFQWLGKIF